MHPCAEASYHFIVNQPQRHRRPAVIPGDGLLQGGSEREFYSGKKPLRPIHRAGFLIWGTVFTGVSMGMIALVISAWKDTSVVLRCLLLVMASFWLLIFFTLGRRMVWSALTAPSESDDEDGDETTLP
jgi:hypothetical protein